LPHIFRGVSAFVERNIPASLISSGQGHLQEVGHSLLDENDMEIYLAEQAGKVVGGVAFRFNPYPWNPDHRVAEETFFWIDTDAPRMTVRSLMTFALERVKARGATIAVMYSLASGGNGFGNFLFRLGFEPVQTSYVRMI
jgi:hypothetical protein